MSRDMYAIPGGRAHLDLRAASLVLVAVALTGMSFAGAPPKIVGALLVSAVVAFAWTPRMVQWRYLIGLLILIILFIPIKRYRLPVDLPFDLEPYRIAVAATVLVWIGSLLIDRRARLRRSQLDGPLLIILGATFVSDLVNPDRVAALGSIVLKEQTFFLSFVLVFYLIVSAVRTRVDLDFLVKLMVGGSAIVAAAGVVERHTNYNIFNHLSTVIPFLEFEGSSDMLRGGRLRVRASSQHPIALSAVFAMMIPLSVYLVRRHGPGRWLVAAGSLTLGLLSTGSRTGIIGLAAAGLVFLAMKPRSVIRLWPALLPSLVVIHFVLPGALGTIRATFFPKGGLVNQQSVVVEGNVEAASGRVADIRPSIGEWSRDPVIGQGYATRITTGELANARILDNQWLATLLETGIIGISAWLWLFVRSVRRLVRQASDEEGDESWLLTGLAASITAFGVMNFTYDTFSFIQITFVFFIVLAVAAALLNIRARDGEAQPARASAG